ncbi:MAG TPA: Do family serine endopeptidase [Allosphingosinicella sp.]|uniref:Do family serine endopeptidase n=1 Tax=Allosphingosinicella sp. TaxID=2823234 RepID=UPI002ED88AC1
MRYAYGITAALLLGGTAATLTFQPSFAQTAQNEPGAMAAAPPRAGAPMSFADLTARLQPAVVNISTKQSVTINRSRAIPPGMEEFFRQFGVVPQQDGGGADNTITQRGTSLGSGFIISADGYIVTNNHVVAPARSNATVEQITVTLADRKEYEAELVGRDATTDLALLKIRANNLPFVRFGDSTQTRVGDWVVAIGNPFGLGGTVTAGIVSALHRNLNAGLYDRYIQTDASINSGNSGGPLFDLNGNVVGINTALYSPTGGNVGVGFAIPAEQARPVIDALRRGQRPERGYLGVGMQDIDDALAEALGIPKNRGELIRSVTPGGAAERAGIQQGDVIVTINNRPVTPDETLAYIVSNLAPGSRVPIELIRNGRRMTVTAVVGQRPTDEELARQSGVEQEQEVTEPAEADQSTGQRAARQSLGVTVQTLTPEIARSLRLNDVNLRGVVVASVDPSSDAGTKLTRGDVIVSINQRATRTPEEAAAAVEAARAAGRTSVMLLVRRQNLPAQYVGVELARR